ncbi:MAG: hypothetical protein N3G19_00335 [Candidatus Pacearchaeota archaeon]|nr:hypothetical protein [Candidatus Pacearchaeota archaeon]
MEFWTIFKWILGIILIAIVFYVLFFGPGKELLKGMGLIAGLPKEAEEQSKNNFDIMLENLEKCNSLKETNCLCEVFPSWPATFAKNYKLVIRTIGKSTVFELIYDKKIHRNATIDQLLTKALIIETTTPTHLFPTKTVDWKTEPPSFLQGKASGKTPYVISSSLYKKEDALYFLISDKKNAKTDIKTCGT